jgi:hypothetical protein
MTNIEKIRLQKWWQEQLRELTRKVMAQEEKRQQTAKKKALAMFGDLAIERREDIDDLYGYGTITEKKRDKLIDLWNQGEQNDLFYDEKIKLLQDAYADSIQTVHDLQKEP